MEIISIHPGEVLKEEFLIPFRLYQKELAEKVGLSVENIEKVTFGKSNISADVALRLAKFFGTSVQFWLGLQSDYDIDLAREQLGDRLEKEIVPIAA